MYWLLWLVCASPVTDVDRTLDRIERKAYTVQQHPESAAEAHSAARAAGEHELEINRRSPGLVRAVEEMSDAARQGNRPVETRDKALEVIARVRAVRCTEE